MTSVSVLEGLREIQTHFSNARNHTEDDPTHVSQVELLAAKGISAAADAVIDAVAKDPGHYSALRGMTREGFFGGDRLMSMADLRASISPPRKVVRYRDRAIAEIGTTAQQIAEVRREVDTVVQNATELQARHTYTVTFKFKKHESIFDSDAESIGGAIFDTIGKNAVNELKATRQTAVVDGDTYRSLREGRKVSRKWDGFGALFGSGGMFTTYDVIVDDKQQLSTFEYRDASGGRHAVTSPEIFTQAVKRLRAERGDSFLVTESADHMEAYALERPLARSDVKSSSPLTRYYATLEIKNSSYTLNLSKHIRNASTAHQIELEVPAAEFEQRGNEFRQGLNIPSFFFTGNLSKLNGRVISTRTEVDQRFRRVELADGRVITMSQADYDRLR